MDEDNSTIQTGDGTMKNTIKQEAKRQLRIELGLLDKTQMLENAEIDENENDDFMEYLDKLIDNLQIKL